MARKVARSGNMPSGPAFNLLLSALEAMLSADTEVMTNLVKSG